jgi:hypothetical protein
MNGELLSQWPAVLNVVCLLLLFCFLVNAALLGGSRRMFSAMFRLLFQRQGRELVVDDVVSREVLAKIFLCAETVLLACLLAYCWICPRIAEETIPRFFQDLGVSFGVVGGYIGYKFLTYLWMAQVFFSKEEWPYWNSQYFSIVSLSSLALFIPTIVILYVPGFRNIAFGFVFLYFIFVKILIPYKVFTIFFQQKSPYLYFILYLCTQELIPLFFVWKTLVHIYSI